MSVLNYIIWNGSPEIFSIGPITLRWYGLLFALGFLISQQILYYMFKQEGKPERDVETLTIFMVIATILGARLGHIVFYEPEMIWTDPAGIFLPFTFTPEFHFTGLQGLASHGGAIGILFALWIYSRYYVGFSKIDEATKKYKYGFFVTRVSRNGQNYLQTLDRIVILVALTGALIRFGNYFNSEILGTPTNFPTGVVFVNRVTEGITGDVSDPNNFVERVSIQRIDSAQVSPEGRVPIKIFIFYKTGVADSDVKIHAQTQIKNILYYLSEFVDEQPGPMQLQTIYDEQDKRIMARIVTNGIVRHPAQLYESISCVVLFVFLFSIWYRYKNDLPEGRIFGFFMVILWGLRFTYEYLKISQVPFEDDLPLNMGQILSIPLFIVGIFILIRSYRKPQINS